MKPEKYWKVSDLPKGSGDRFSGGFEEEGIGCLMLAVDPGELTVYSI